MGSAAAVYVYASGWVKKQNRHLLLFFGVICVLWLLLFYYLNGKSSSVSRTSVQRDLQTSKYRGRDTWDEKFRRHWYSHKKPMTPANFSFWQKRPMYNVSYHVNEHTEHGRADVSQRSSRRANFTSTFWQKKPTYNVSYRVKEHTEHRRANVSQNSSRSMRDGNSLGNQKKRNDSMMLSTDFKKPKTRFRPYSALQDSTGNAAGNLIPGWLRRSDPSLQKLLRRNVSKFALNPRLSEEGRSTAKFVQKPLKPPVGKLLLASGRKPSGSFELDMRRSADDQKRIAISIVDSGYTNFAVNFQRMSVDTIGLQNFMFVCIDREAVTILEQHGIVCSYFQKSTEVQNIVSEKETQRKTTTPATASDFGSTAYFRKSNVKTLVVLDVLNHGYSVLTIDPDVILFKNPFPYFNCTSCDIHFQMDRDMYNSGFAFIRPTASSIRLYNMAWDLYIKYHKSHDQAYVNMAIDKLNKNIRSAPEVRIQSLPRSLFPCGIYYFEHQHRMFNNRPPCPECVMVHNNYIGSVAAKIYRFKENYMWTIDEDKYYSSTTARYITYDNPRNFGRNTSSYELEALKSALAIAVASNRILILPSFRCCSGCSAKSRVRCSSPKFRCSLLSLLRLNVFDRVFANRYREHSFLYNRLVPNRIKRSVSVKPIFLHVSGVQEAPQLVDEKAVQVVKVANHSHGATLPEIVQLISKFNKTAVVRFHSLYGNMVNWEDDAEFGSKLKLQFKAAFECSEYQQWEGRMLNLANMWPGKNVGTTPRYRGFRQF